MVKNNILENHKTIQGMIEFYIYIVKLSLK